MNNNYLSMEEIFDQYYDELTRLERDVITTTDYVTTTIKMFTDVADFKDYVKLYFTEDDVY